MSTKKAAKKNGVRHDFTKFEPLLPIPDLLAIQLDSWESFLQEDILPEKRENKGLEAVFKNMFPISLSSLEYSQEAMDVEYFRAMASFRYLYYEFETAT